VSTSAAESSAEVSTSSTTVTLSAEAQQFASFAAAGITFTEFSISSLGGSPGAFADASPAQQFAMLQAAAGTPHVGGAVTQAGFEKLVAQFGGTKAQADQLFTSLDTNADGSISNKEFLNALANTAKDPGSPVSQLLLGLMNTDHSGSVSLTQFGQFETAFVRAEH
jgi:hypothetical protein